MGDREKKEIIREGVRVVGKYLCVVEGFTGKIGNNHIGNSRLAMQGYFSRYSDVPEVIALKSSIRDYENARANLGDAKFKFELGRKNLVDFLFQLGGEKNGD